MDRIEAKPPREKQGISIFAFFVVVVVVVVVFLGNCPCPFEEMMKFGINKSYNGKTGRVLNNQQLNTSYLSENWRLF